jgi:hypothetical protein
MHYDIQDKDTPQNDIQHENTHQNDIQHNSTQQNDSRYDETRQNAIQHFEIHQNDIRHNKMPCSFTGLLLQFIFYPECHSAKRRCAKCCGTKGLLKLDLRAVC